MLGPADIADWGDDDCDRLRAEIRLLPIMRRLAAEPGAAHAALGGALAARLDAFRRDARLPHDELRRLRDELDTVR